MRLQLGVTLIELMLVVAIIGLLMAIALPSYRVQVAAGYRAEAQSELTRLANLQEQYFMDNHTYVADMTRLGASADPFVTLSGRFSVDAVEASASRFTLQATALGGQAQADSACAELTLSDAGERTPAGCW
ncbi:type IV pilus assembly protein PilE [Ferrimonas sediminum]|uniref:Type IV pilus assembly protein PilE n=1 Tax=Ferrimonas sediminum TaxID=718193 RepID=A0A1G8ZC08_9GAMM|nr:type IV pilin protein [Ferrimonas sediminum]SDK12656.1 type IV pilus assembly protein PilE [Ferrimonas sediminum]